MLWHMVGKQLSERLMQSIMQKHNSLKARIFGKLGRCGLTAFMALLGQVSSLQAQTTLNVANYGAIGDAVQFWASTTSNSVLVTTTTRLSTAAIGDAIELFQAGAQTYGVNSFGTNGFGNQDLLATITNIINGTNIYISTRAQSTLSHTFATYGHNNQTNFQNTLAAASGTNTIINIPAGTYLTLGSINLYGGGITLNGAGTNVTTLLGQGAWTLVNYPNVSNWPTRGQLIIEQTPVTNNYPVVLQNMTLDGGVQYGNIATQNGSIRGIYANPVDGMQWDTTHDAFLVAGPGHGAINNMTWTNLVFQHWRGEMVKSVDSSTNGNLNIFNSVFNDGQATAINIYPSLNVSNCVFNNLTEVAEYYQAQCTNTCYFQHNLCTNIVTGEFAINGGKGSNPYFIMSDNTFYINLGCNGIQTCPGDNLIISNNLFICQPYVTAICIGVSGYQGTWDNSNIVITANTIVNPVTCFNLSGSGPTDPNRSENIKIFNNLITHGSNTVPVSLVTSWWTSNVNIYSNICTELEYNNWVTASTGYAGGSPYAFVDVNNEYFTPVNAGGGTTNFISYGTGSKYNVLAAQRSTLFALQTSDASQIPPGAQMMISNSAGVAIPIYLSSNFTSSAVTLTNGGSTIFQWSKGAWQLAAAPLPPSDLHVIPSP
jgi:hypothetical protein